MNIIQDFIWLVLTVYLEAQGETQDGQIMVAMSIMNRSEQRGITVKEVVLQSKQYSCWNKYNDSGKMPDVTWTDDFIACYDSCIKALGLVMSGENFDGVNHYFNPDKCNPSWAKKMVLIDQIGNHKFFKG